MTQPMTQPMTAPIQDNASSQRNEAIDADRELLQQTLAHRFRHTLHTGQVSPLLHLMLRYRQAHRQEVRPCTTQS
jgi:hypothetical protein